MLQPSDVVVSDIDDVLYPFYVQQCEIVRLNLGIEISMEDRTAPYLSLSHSSLGFTKELELKTVDMTYRSSGFAQAQPLPGSLEVVKWLADRCRLVAMTARPGWMEQATRDWLESHFPGCFSDVLIMGLVGTAEHSTTKVEASAKIGAKAMIEDVRHNLQGCSLHGISGFLVDRPWNRQEPAHPDFVRVGSTHGVLEHFGVPEVELVA